MILQVPILALCKQELEKKSQCAEVRYAGDIKQRRREITNAVI